MLIDRTSLKFQASPQTSTKNGAQEIANIDQLLSQFKELANQAKSSELSSALQVATQTIEHLLKKNSELQLAEKQLALLKAKLPLACFSWDLEFRVTDYNEAASKLFGYEPSEIIGENLFDLVIPDEVREIVKKKLYLVDQHPDGQANQNENIIKGGKSISCQWINFPLFNSEGVWIGTTAIGQDLARNQVFRDLLQQAEARWLHYWENIPDGIAEIDLDGKIILANRALYSQARDIKPDSINLFDYVPEERRATLRQVIKKAITTATTQTYELPLVDERQAKWWSSLIIPIVKNKLVVSLLVVSSDVTERKMAYQEIEQQVQERTEVLLKINQELKDEIYTRKQVEASLRDSESRYYRLTSISPVGIFRADSKGRTIYMNERYIEIIGLPLHEALGYGWTKTIHPDDFDRVMKDTYHAWEHQLSLKSKLRHLHKDGTVVWVIAEFLNETDDQGNFKGFVGTLTDITRLMLAEEKIHQHEAELEHRARINMIGEMISGIAHEVNQPLAMIVNYTGGCLEYLQREKGVSPKILQMMQRAFDQAERAGKIIHRLKEFLRKGTLQKESLNINSTIRDAISLVSGVLRDAKINLKLELADKLPLVCADKIQVEQVVLNLVNNAVDAMMDASWLFRKITIKTQISLKNSDQLEIRVLDTGPGIAPEIADKIFDPFFTTKETGMGVGLSISATILEVHGGRISLDREYRDGTAFIITLPISRGEL